MQKLFTACSLGVYKNQQQTVLYFGDCKQNSLFDVASVTKIIPTVTLFLQLLEKKSFSLDTLLCQILPEYTSADKNTVKIKHLLTYTICPDTYGPLSYHLNTPPEKILQLILQNPLLKPAGTVFQYNNSASILMGLILEKLYQQKLHHLADQLLFKPLKMTSTTFYPTPEEQKLCIPTEITPDRGVVQGFVHDESTYALQKVITPGCAGLFSTASDLLIFQKNIKKLFKSETLIQMQTNQLANINANHGLGWEIAEPLFMGKHNKDLIGKTGFTGTMILSNLKSDTHLTLLTNATYPKRPLNREPLNQLRREMADLVFG